MTGTCGETLTRRLNIDCANPFRPAKPHKASIAAFQKSYIRCAYYAYSSPHFRFIAESSTMYVPAGIDWADDMNLVMVIIPG